VSRIRDLLNDRELFHVQEDGTVASVSRRMTQLHVGAILVMSGDNLCGIFSERDLMQRVVVEGRDPETTPVKAVMSTQIATIDELASVEAAMEAMKAHNCRHLPVTRGSRVVGFLSMRDVMNHELASKTEELYHMRAYIHGNT
jgi:signal-transduction protein with cAMP-binding, CBS, and nucleotidyltransferase domain